MVVRNTVIEERRTKVFDLVEAAKKILSNYYEKAKATTQQSTTVAAAVQQTTANVQTVAAAAEELSTSGQEISRQIAQSASIAQSAVAQADRTNAMVEGLLEATQKIGEAMRFIQNIAAQTF